MTETILIKESLDHRITEQHNFLVVDDEPSIVSLFHKLLAPRGHVETASNGLEALEKLRGRRVDIIITDLKMPVMTGLEFFQESIRDNPIIRSHFLFCTGNASSDELRFLRENDLPYLLKPFKINQFVEKVDEVLNRRAPLN